MSVLERFARHNHSVKSVPDRIKPRPIQLHSSDDEHTKGRRRQSADDGQMRRLFGRKKGVMSHLLSPTVRQFSFDGSSNALFVQMSQVPHRDQSANSQHSGHSGRSFESYEAELEWAKEELLTMSDDVRASIRHNESLGAEAERLRSFLDAVLKDEGRRQHPSTEFSTIEYARLDKLLDEIINLAQTKKGQAHGTEELRMRVDAATAGKLRHIWRQRFREQYFMIDQLRCGVLVRGPLKDVSFNTSLTYDLGVWEAAASKPMSELESKLQFEAGHWWLNIACAQRDSIVTSMLEVPTKGRYGTLALPLLTGTEEVVRVGQGERVKYIRYGSRSEMHIPLISQVGTTIRIVRGYRLKSKYAPEAGIRYDGLYIIRQYGFKFDSGLEQHRLELLLQRVDDQKPMETLARVPTPSQLDDWNLCQKLEGDKVKLTGGDVKYMEWSLMREEEKLQREEWKRDREFRASIA